jgi:hypothetical protein
MAGFKVITEVAASTALSNIYIPVVNRTVGQNVTSYGITLGIDGAVNILREFRSGR